MSPSPRPGPQPFVAVLRESSFLERLPEAVADRVIALVRHAAYEPGEIVLREGAPTPFLGIVTSGRIALRLMVPGRGSTTVLTVDVGELLGWSALVPPFRSTSTAVALEASEVAIIDAATLRAEMSDPAFAAAVLPPVLETVAGRLGESRAQLLDLFGGPAVEPL